MTACLSFPIAPSLFPAWVEAFVESAFLGSHRPTWICLLSMSVPQEQNLARHHSRCWLPGLFRPTMLMAPVTPLDQVRFDPLYAAQGCTGIRTGLSPSPAKLDSRYSHDGLNYSPLSLGAYWGLRFPGYKDNISFYLQSIFSLMSITNLLLGPGRFDGRFFLCSFRVKPLPHSLDLPAVWHCIHLIHLFCLLLTAHSDQTPVASPVR